MRLILGYVAHMARSLLEINHLSIYFRDGDRSFTAVDDVSLSIERGETLALVGESGSGKTLIALAALQLLPNAARVSAASQIILSGKEQLLTPSSWHGCQDPDRRKRNFHVPVNWIPASMPGRRAVTGTVSLGTTSTTSTT